MWLSAFIEQYDSIPHNHTKYVPHNYLKVDNMDTKIKVMGKKKLLTASHFWKEMQWKLTVRHMQLQVEITLRQ